jgi:hypothetical protein
MYDRSFNLELLRYYVTNKSTKNTSYLNLFSYNPSVP